MNNETTLRDWLAMNAPWEDVPREDLTKGEKMGCLDKCLEDEARLRYRWADAVLRVRDETMPKRERVHPEWARWAARDEDGECFYFDSTPQIDGCVWTNGKPKRFGREFIDSETSFIPSDWRKSLTPVNQ